MMKRYYVSTDLLFITDEGKERNYHSWTWTMEGCRFNDVFNTHEFNSEKKVLNHMKDIQRHVARIHKILYSKRINDEYIIYKDPIYPDKKVKLSWLEDVQIIVHEACGDTYSYHVH